jgi:hypothetical protein
VRTVVVVDGESLRSRRRDGREVVSVSKEPHAKTKPNLKSYLLHAGYAEEKDVFDLIMKDVRSGPPLFAPRDAVPGDRKE